MATEVKLPRLGQGMEAGTIVKWLKSEGERVEKGEPLYELDTEKVTQEVEAEAAGVLLKIAVREGEVEVGRTVAIIGEEGEKPPESDDSGGEPALDEAPQSAEKPAEAPKREPERERGREASAEPEAPAEPPAPTDGGRVKASPLARRIARERGVELAGIRGTGPDGRIVAEDVERAAAMPAATAAAPAAIAAATAPPAELEREQLTSMRKTIARRLTEAWTVPAFQLTVSADMTRAQELVGALRARAPEGSPKITLSDVLTKVCAAALMRHRDVNARFADDAVELWPTANVGLAVAIPKGLVVPVIPAADRKTIAEIAAARAALVERARAGKLSQAELENGTFTISNLGMFGIEQFTAVLNPPQAAILATGATQERPVVRGGGDGDLVVLPMMTMTLTCDHRTIDGATGSEFLGTVKAFLEEPALAL